MTRPVPLLLALALALPSLCAQEQEPLAQNPDSFLVPPPEAVFNALAKVPNADFAKLAAMTGPASTKEKLDKASSKLRAMIIGIRVADAYVAVQARDVVAYQRATDAIEMLATEFSGDETFRRKLVTTTKMAKSERWLDLKTILETVRGDIVRELRLHQNQDAVTLATLGGWLRGLQLSTWVLMNNYDNDSTRLLRQPALVSHLKRKVNALGPDTKAEAFVELITENMPELVKLVDAPSTQPVTLPDVKRLQALSSQLIKAALP